jgi:ankyrin repeat protein
MNLFHNSRLQLSMIVALALCAFGCNAAKRATTTPETDALLRAARTGNADTVRSLLASPNVDVNGVDADGNTPLIEASRFGHDEVVTALLLAKADVNAKTRDGKTALMLAAEGGHDEVVRLLTQAGSAR